MMTPMTIHMDDLASMSDVRLPPSEWRTIQQEHIDLFAKATEDYQWIHCDVERAASGPFGRTIAHGYLTLSLVPAMLSEVLELQGKGSGVNYGLDRVRFTSPVPSGSAVRLQSRIDRAEAGSGGVRYWVDIEVELRGSDKPAAVGRLVVLAIPA